MPHKKVKSLSVSGEGAVVSLLEKGGKTYLAVQNRDCVNEAELNIEFSGKARMFTIDGIKRVESNKMTLLPGNIAIFIL
jgi:hypothetical protein